MDIDCARRVLGVKAEATEEEVKRAYWRIAHRVHPDKNGDANAERKKELAERFMEATRAKCLLLTKKPTSTVSKKNPRTVWTPATERRGPPVERVHPSSKSQSTSYCSGPRVTHETLGDGTVLWAQDVARDTKLGIQFNDGRIRTLLVSIAKLRHLKYE